MNLERNLIDNVLECELKLGHEEKPISFYYPVTSLTELLHCEEKELASAIPEFLAEEQNRLGNVRIKELPKEAGRYEVTVPAAGVKWVHENFQPSEFMSRFVTEIKRPGNTLEDMVELFRNFSPDVEVEKVCEEEWAVSFKKREIDPYVYHIEQNEFGLEYHRFTKEAYRKTMEG